jgi:copper chaperone CopZ
MKSLLSTIIITLIFCVYSCKNGGNTVSESVVHVWGNCEKCKATIENSCNLKGVTKATWDVDSKLLTLKLDTNVVSVDAVLQSISKSGYDNEKYFANDYAYDNLPQCCQYERRPFDAK